MKAMIFGAREGSLGAEIKEEMECVGRELLSGMTVVTAGISGEDLRLDASDRFFETDVYNSVMEEQPNIIAITTGVNEPGGVARIPLIKKNMDINFFGPMRILASVDMISPPFRPAAIAVISSNSAHIARRGSVGYCSSKAALSMGIRCVARDWATDLNKPRLWGYELGLLKGTPMTQGTEARFGPAQSRMLGAEAGLEPSAVAQRIAADLTGSSALLKALNGTCIRLDAGEQ